MTTTSYVGRFAPSPTGPLHFGSLLAALGSCLEARIHGGRWLLRMEDVDEPRCSQEAADRILRALEQCGFAWDGPVVMQSECKALYRDALDHLRAVGLAYPCACTRRELADSALAPDGATIYPGTCRNGLPPGKQARAWRLKVADETICFDDALQGRCCQDLGREVGDFVLLRADGYFAYQLAVVVDDAEQGITHIVRGADLLASTPRQIHLQSRLGLPTPAYAHLPVAVDAAGEKLSKQTLAAPVQAGAPVLVDALAFLGQRPPADLRSAAIEDIWAWAMDNWTLAAVPRRRALCTEFLAGAVAGEADGQPNH